MSNHAVRIIPGDFTDRRVLGLIGEHLQGMHASSPPGSVYALDLSGLQTPDIEFFTAWQDEELLGCAALKHLDANTGEIKSMRTAAAHLRKGVAARLLEHLLTLARSRGYRRLSLETGSGAPFEPALRLYERYGFQVGAPFGGYTPTTFNRFLHLTIDDRRE